jgi:hypothetical protein
VLLVLLVLLVLALDIEIDILVDELVDGGSDEILDEVDPVDVDEMELVVVLLVIEGLEADVLDAVEVVEELLAVDVELVVAELLVVTELLVVSELLVVAAELVDEGAELLDVDTGVEDVSELEVDATALELVVGATEDGATLDDDLEIALEVDDMATEDEELDTGGGQTGRGISFILIKPGTFWNAKVFFSHAQLMLPGEA